MTSPPAAPATRYETVIGIEIHVQLKTVSKMFCACSTDVAGAPPNSHTCPVCLGLPGALPVINRRAVEHVLATGLAIGSTIPDATRWDRKNYFCRWREAEPSPWKPLLVRWSSPSGAPTSRKTPRGCFTL